MKKLICTALASLMLLSAVSCGRAVPDTAVTATASAAEQILIDRLGEVPENVVLGDAVAAAEYGIDMTNFESDGYVLRTVGETTLVFGKTDEGLDRAVRAYAKAVEGGCTDTLDVVYHEGYRIENLTIAGRDISEYTVYYPETANENMKFAADELVRLVEKATGVKLPVVVGAPVSPAIELRHSDDPALKNDGYRYSVTENGVIIEGAVKRGCMNGVWRFLQWELGWDQLIYGDSYLNEAEYVEISVGTERSETPIFEYLYLGENRNLPNNFQSNECSIPTTIQNSYGTPTPAWHGMQDNNYFETTDFYNQPCFNDEEQYEICIYNVEKYIAARYGAPDFFQVDIAQYDSNNYCFCEKCVEVYIEEGYTHSGSVVRFANRLSEEMNEIYPGLIYKIFAYAGTNKAPEVTVPNEHIYVTFCYDMNCSNHSLDGKDCNTKIEANSRTNRDYDEWLRGWSELTKNIYIWEYNLYNPLLDFTTLHTLYDNMQYYRKLGVKGLYMESRFYGIGIKNLEKMLRAEINWNPDITEEELEEVYCTILEHQFGDGWVYIRDYMNEWVLAQSLTGCFTCWAWGAQYFQHEDRINTHFYKDRFDDYMELFDAAIYAANSVAQEKRIEVISCNMIYLGCYSSYFFEYLAGNTERLDVIEERYALLWQRLRNSGFYPYYLHTHIEVIAMCGTAYEQAWTHWYKRFERITGRPLPADAPIIAPETE